MNNNINNDQDMIIREKIEKREKIDTILAYVLIVVLVVSIGVVLGLKFLGGGEEDTPVDEYTPTYISLGEISTALNNSVLANRYMNDGASFASIVNGNSIVVTYNKDDVVLNIEMPMVGNELMVNIPVKNREIYNEVYKEVANIICLYYGNEEKYCRYTLNNIGDSGINGIRIDNNGENNLVYITTTESFDVDKEIMYREVVVSDYDDTDYSLELLDVKVSNINIIESDTSVKFYFDVSRLNDDNSNFGVLIKLYDMNGSILSENNYQYNEENVLDGTGTTEVEFLLNDTLKLDDINKYSIEITK